MTKARTSDWQDVNLGDVLTLQRGFDITRKELVPGAVPVVSSSGIAYFHDEARVSPPGVVVGRKGSLGTVYWIDVPFWPHDTTLWVKDFKGNDPYFCYLLLQSLGLASLDVGAANPTLNRNHAHRIPVRSPSIQIQRRVSAFASAFDELISINRRRVERLEELGRSMYRAWISRAAAESSGDGSVGRVSDLAELVVEGVDVDEFQPEDRYVGLEHLPRRKTTLEHWGSPSSVRSRKLRFQRGDTLFGKIRPNLHKVAWAPFDGLASSDAMIFRPTGGRMNAFLNAVLASDHVVALATATSNGTKMPRADPAVLLDVEVPIPAEELLEAFEDSTSTWLEYAAMLMAENRALEQTRSLVVPRLVKGLIDLSRVDLGVLTPPDQG